MDKDMVKSFVSIVIITIISVLAIYLTVRLVG